MQQPSTFRLYLKRFFLLFALCFYVTLGFGINYIFPSYNITQITGVEVKRVDKDGPISKANPADGPTRDVYYIYTQNPNTNDVVVYRNEDTRWGFPFYFKFDSANLQAQAQGFANEKQWVQVKYYGWRLTLIDEFPNITTLKAVNSDTTPSHPIVSYILYIILLILFFFTVQFIRGWYDSEKQ
ncbi:hypothetical protein CEP45_07395 [Mergibacter septicus]|uniref:DUF1523 family protein n=1 Tax=Mergibacter septicus TaxID=221402 RepID=UPI001C768990|nr:DUF1523 family protein [Mergibacter septicus]QDJ13679.1 hypothetical protein CEP45_07395 [Mergibacter septicus]